MILLSSNYSQLYYGSIHTKLRFEALIGVDPKLEKLHALLFSDAAVDFGRIDRANFGPRKTNLHIAGLAIMRIIPSDRVDTS